MAAPQVYSVWGPEKDEDVKMGLSPTLRSYLSPSGEIPTTCLDGSKTAWEIFDNSVKRNGPRPCLGQRTLLKRDYVKSADGKKTFEKVDLSEEYSWRTYSETHKRVEQLASGMVKEMGFQAKDKVLIFAETEPAWMEAALACWRQNIVVVTAYATLGVDGVVSALNQSKSTTCICNARLFEIVKTARNSCPTLKNVVVIPSKVDPSIEELQKAFGEGINVKTIEQLIAAGSDLVPSNPCDPSDIAVIMYTSGSTGNAKGVIELHSQAAAGTRSATACLPYINNTSVYMAYLPLAHIMELFTEWCGLYVGASLGYGNPQTLTDTGVKLNKGQRGDAPTLKPTVMVFAPAVLDKVYAGVMDKIRGTGCKEKLFMAALANGYSNYEAGGVGATCCWNKLFAASVQGLIGGRLKHIVAGSAPLSPEIQKFAQTTLNAPTRQGYGLTETCGASTLAHETDNTLSQVGGPTPGTILRLRDWPEGNYLNADLKKPGVEMRRGEILLGGPTISPGYWIDETNPDTEIQAKNKEDWLTVDGERYFCTGDVGAVTKKGQLKIVDRKKDLFKGAAGEYVSLSKVESLAKLSQFVETCMCYGQTGAKGVIMLVVPKKAAVDKFAQENGLTVSAGKYAEVGAKKEFVDQVSKSVLAECKAGGLAGFEMPGAVGLCIAPDGAPAWTPDNEMLTTTMKMKRPVIAGAFASVIEETYSRVR